MKLDSTAVIAIGGNFLSEGDSTVQEQMERAYQAAVLVKEMVFRNMNVVVVHGNGPQVGMTYLQQLAGMKENIPPHNLAMCDALTQAEIGTMLELAIINTINSKKSDFDVLTLVSQVEVDAKDPAFKTPTKPVGPFYSDEEHVSIQKKFPDWVIKEDSGRGFRRVVPSPVPIKVFATTSIPDAFHTANVIIAGGGGGIPVVRKPDNTFELVDAVIDKDRTSCLIALEIKATHFFLLTGVAHVAVNFGKPDQRELGNISLAEIERYYNEGQFPPGSMGPKVEAAMEFVRKGGGTAVITDAEHIAHALEGKQGTRIHP
jgi:carbamate kinase